MQKIYMSCHTCKIMLSTLKSKLNSRIYTHMLIHIYSQNSTKIISFKNNLTTVHSFWQFKVALGSLAIVHFKLDLCLTKKLECIMFYHAKEILFNKENFRCIVGHILVLIYLSIIKNLYTTFSVGVSNFHIVFL